MKDKLKNVFKETPERFSYVVDDALSQARLKGTKKRISPPLRIVIAVVLIFAVIPSTVVCAVKLYGAVAQCEDNFGVSFDISINEDAPQYVKMDVETPEGFIEVPHTDGLKCHRIGEESIGFSILPMRFYENVDHTALAKDVKEYKEVVIASRPSYELISTDDYRGAKRYYVWYEEVNVLVLIYCGETITDSELETFVEGISFTHGSKAENDIFFEPESYVQGNTQDIQYEEREYIEMSTDTQFVLSGSNEDFSESGFEIESKITDIRITDNINELDESGFNDSFELSEVVDANGKFLPRTVEVWRDGDGINTTSKQLSTESKEQNLVLVDIEFKNTTDKEVWVYVPHRLGTLIKNEEGNYNSSTIIDDAQNIYVYADGYYDSEMFYMSYHGNGKQFYMPKLQPYEKKTITIGFRCIEEQISNAYITIDALTDGVITPVYNGDNSYVSYILEVQ